MIEAKLLEEPQLLFGSGQTAQHPRIGLTLFGPVDAASARVLKIGYIGPPEGIEAMKACMSRLMNPLRFPLDPKARVVFPGFEALFGCALPEVFSIERHIDFHTLKRTLMIEERRQRIFKTVELYRSVLERSRKEDEVQPDLWLAYIPNVLYEHCRPQSSQLRDANLRPEPSLSLQSLKKKLNNLMAKQGLLFEEEVDGVTALEATEYKEDFRDQLKRKLLNSQIAIQLVRENTLAELVELERAFQAFSANPRRQSALYTHANDTLWNLSTGLFYKTCGNPWKLANLRPGVCYVGLVFKRTERDYGATRSGRKGPSQTACCAAQMFLDSGDGTVFKGAVGPWYSPTTKECHLDRSAAKRLIEMAVDGYKDRFGGENPKELFIHGRASFNDEEWGGFSAAVPAITKLSGVRIGDRTPIRLYPQSELVALRGVACVLDARHGLLLTNGWIPRMQTYPGREVPTPLRVDVVRGDADIVTVLEDILKLTKLNYNACMYGDGIPVTLRFADSIGSILTAGPDFETPPLPFRYYI